MEIFKKIIKEHEVIVYDENGVKLCKSMESIHVNHIIRYKHTFSDYITYSFNTHLKNGLICYGMIIPPPCQNAYLFKEK